MPSVGPESANFTTIGPADLAANTQGREGQPSWFRQLASVSRDLVSISRGRRFSVGRPFPILKLRRVCRKIKQISDCESYIVVFSLSEIQTEKSS